MKPITQFTTHKGEIVKGKRLRAALEKVADAMAQLARDIRRENAYASHVTEEVKFEMLKRGIERSRIVRAGFVDNMTVAQNLNYELTGECPALLPKY